MFCAPLGEDEADEEADDEGENPENEKYPMLTVVLKILLMSMIESMRVIDCSLILDS